MSKKNTSKLEFWAPQNRPKHGFWSKVVLSLEIWGCQKGHKGTSFVKNTQNGWKVVLAFENGLPKTAVLEGHMCDVYGPAEENRHVET